MSVVNTKESQQEKQTVAKLEFKTKLASKINEGFSKAVLFRKECGVSERLQSALSAWSKTASSQEEMFFKSIGVDTKTSYDCLIKQKMNAVASLLHRILLPTSGKSWSVAEATPDPEIPEHIEAAAYGVILSEYFQLASANMQVDPDGAAQMLQPEAIMGYVQSRSEEIDTAKVNFASKRAKKMDKKIDDILREGGLGDVLSDFIWNLVIFGTGVVIGPCDEITQVVKIKDRTTKKQDAEKALISVPYKLENEKRMGFFCPPTCDVYPSKGTRRPEDGFVFIKVAFEPSRLAEFAATAKDKTRVLGWDAAAVGRVLERYPFGGVDLVDKTLDQEMRRMMKDWAGGAEDSTSIEGVRCFGKFPGSYLLECGIKTTEDREVIFGDRYYDIDAVLILNEIVYVRVCDPVIGRPVHKCTFYGTRLSWFGDGLADVLQPLQSLALVCVAGLKKQSQMTSGPERVVNDVDSFVNSNVPGYFSPSPWKIHLRRSNPFQTPQAGSTAPLSYVQMPHTIAELLRILETIPRMVDDYSGFPRNMFGSGNLAGAARALADYERVLTPNGAVRICDLKVGDDVFNAYSGVSKVLGVYPQGMRDVYRFRFSNGEKVDCDLEHRWSVSDHPERKNSWKVMTTGELLEAGIYRATKVGKKNPKGFRPKYCLPRVEALGYEKKEVPIDPYTLGALLGNGDSRCRLTQSDMEAFDQIPYELGVEDWKGGGTSVARTVMGIRGKYRALGLNCKTVDKFIPKAYLHNSEEVRMALLQGLMDTDGCVSENGDHVFFSTSSPKMRYDFVELVKSLGATSVSVGTEAGGEFEMKAKKRVRQANYRVLFNLDHKRVFRLERKQSRITGRARKRVYITGIELLSEKHSATCITVDAKDSLYLCENFIPTHNTARGLAQIRESANIVADFVIMNIDKQVTTPVIEALVRWLNVRGTDDTIKGDVRIIARGALGQALQTAKEETITAALAVAGNGIFPQILGPKALTTMFRNYLKIIDYEEIDEITPSKEKLELQEALDLLGKMQQAQGQQTANEQAQVDLNQQAGGVNVAPRRGVGGSPSRSGYAGDTEMSLNRQPIGLDVAGGTRNLAGGVKERRASA